MDHHEKLAWSAQHLHTLDLEIKDFVKRHPFTARGHHRHGTREFGVIVDPMPLLPPHWPLMAGDAIHNMRGALDHIVWALTAKSPTQPNARQLLQIGYPISITEGAYWGDRKKGEIGARARHAGWVGEDALAIIDGTQPYRRGDDANKHPLSVIAAFSNEDKHRNLVASAVLATSVSVRIEQSAPGRQFALSGFDFHPSEKGWLYTGADLGTVEFHEGTIGCEDMVVKPIFGGTVGFRARRSELAVNVSSLEKVLNTIHSEIVAPLDNILCR